MWGRGPSRASPRSPTSPRLGAPATTAPAPTPTPTCPHPRPRPHPHPRPRPTRTRTRTCTRTRARALTQPHPHSRSRRSTVPPRSDIPLHRGSDRPYFPHHLLLAVNSRVRVRRPSEKPPPTLAARLHHTPRMSDTLAQRSADETAGLLGVHHYCGWREGDYEESEEQASEEEAPPPNVM